MNRKKIPALILAAAGTAILLATGGVFAVNTVFAAEEYRNALVKALSLTKNSSSSCFRYGFLMLSISSSSSRYMVSLSFPLTGS